MPTTTGPDKIRVATPPDPTEVVTTVTGDQGIAQGPVLHTGAVVPAAESKVGTALATTDRPTAATMVAVATAEATEEGAEMTAISMPKRGVNLTGTQTTKVLEAPTPILEMD